MPDKKLTDNEIVKALECCLANTNDNCSVCHFSGSNQSCIDVLIQYALDLINRLQARVEKCEKVEYFADKTIATLQAENEKLKENLNIELENFATEYDNKIKAEAYKEFAEKLCEDWQEGEDEVRCVINIPRWIMHTYEEMVGDAECS